MSHYSSQWQVGLSTDMGPVRTRNEDHLFFRVTSDRKGNEIGIAIVADGMGGYQVGDVASFIAIEMIQKWWDKRSRKLLSAEDPIELAVQELESFILKINEHLLEVYKKEKKKLGTTLSILLVYSGKYAIVHIGDSRIYQATGGRAGFQDYFRKQQQLHQKMATDELHDTVSLEEETKLIQLTEDHSWVQDQVRKGMLTPEEAHNHAKRNVLLQCLGVTNKIEPFIHLGQYDPNDIFLLCSDGFYSVLSEKKIEGMLQQLESKYTNLQRISDHFIQVSVKAGTTDNITVLLVRNMYPPKLSFERKRSIFSSLFNL